MKIPPQMEYEPRHSHLRLQAINWQDCSIEIREASLGDFEVSNVFVHAEIEKSTLGYEFTEAKKSCQLPTTIMKPFLQEPKYLNTLHPAVHTCLLQSCQQVRGRE